MRFKDLDYLVILLLALGSLYLLLTGLLMETMGLHRLAGHSWVGYAWVVLAALHLGLSWPQMKAYWGHRFRHPPHRVQPKSELNAPAEPTTDRRRWLTSLLALAGGFLLGRFVSATEEIPETSADLGLSYHQWSQLSYQQALKSLLPWGDQPAPYKSYPNSEPVPLPPPTGATEVSLAKAVSRSECLRQRYPALSTGLHRRPPVPVNLSRLLYWAQGLTAGERRAVPSAGALYPLEVYVIAHQVEGLPPGIYHYAVRGHGLERLRQGDFRGAVVAAGLGQGFLGQASACLAISAIWQRTAWKYRERTYRYVLMEAGHLGQNVYLGATALGLGACAVGAFLDGELNELLGLDGQEEAALYLVAIGSI